MSSIKRKQQRLRESQVVRAKAMVGIDPTDLTIEPPCGAVMAERANLGHNNTYSQLPRFYIDKVVCCRQCGSTRYGLPGARTAIRSWRSKHSIDAARASSSI